MDVIDDRVPFYQRHGDLLIGMVLVGAIFGAYWEVGGHDFINYDDPLYVTENPYLAKGISLEGIYWALTTVHANFWHPLTWMSYLIDFQVYGPAPGGFLLTNLLIHALSALVLFAVFKNMTGALWRSALVAALFALHPINVESVAWVAERKNVLSTLFWMLTIWGYERYAAHPTAGRRLGVLALFVLGLMAKPMLVTLPFVFLLLDYWPLRRWENAVNRSRSGAETFVRLVSEKLLFFLCSAVFSVVAFVAQNKGGALAALNAYPLSVRVGNAVVSYAAYLRKMIWPTDLTLFYPHGGMPSWGKIGAALAVLIMVTFFVLRHAKSRPWFVVGWLWYLGTLVPVIGLVQIGAFSMADRFAYVPLIGIFIMLSWSATGRWETFRGSRVGMTLCWGAVLAAMIWATQKQVGYWQNSTTLFRHSLAVAGKHPVFFNSLGGAMVDSGDIQSAVRYYRKALDMDPYNEEIMSNLAAVLADQGKLDEATGLLHAALQIDPFLAKAHVNLGNLHARQGRLVQAINDYRRALDIDPSMVTACNNLGVALARNGNIEAALVQFERALQIRPDYDSARKNLAHYRIVSKRGNKGPQKVQR